MLGDNKAFSGFSLSQIHFFGFAFFTADFLTPFFALLPCSRTLLKARPLLHPRYGGVSLAQERPRRLVIGHVPF